MNHLPRGHKVTHNLMNDPRCIHLLYDFMMDFWFLIFISRCFFSSLHRAQFFHLSRVFLHNKMYTMRVHFIFSYCNLQSTSFVWTWMWFCLPGWRSHTTDTNVKNFKAKENSILEYLIWLEKKKKSKRKVQWYVCGNDKSLIFGNFEQFVFFLNHGNITSSYKILAILFLLILLFSWIKQMSWFSDHSLEM